jgi:NitT/TauT family transport system substrate-binding protein
MLPTRRACSLLARCRRERHDEVKNMSTVRLLAGVAAAVALAAPATAQETRVRFALDWKFEAPSAPYFIALDEGYYAAEGLDVSIDSGSGSTQTIPRIASGNYDMGFGDINSLIKFKDQNPDASVIAVMMTYETPPFAIISLAGRGVEAAAPSSLEGKTLGAPPPDAAYAQWPIFVEVNDIDTSTITIENVGFPVREPMLAAGDVDGIFGYSFSSVQNLKLNEVPEEDISVMLMADHGLALYGNAVMANTDFAEANPEAVAGFIRATIRGWRDTVADPAGAVPHVLRRNDVAREDVELDRLRMVLEDNVLTDVVAEEGIGGVDMARLARSIDQIAVAYDYTNKPTAEEIFTDAYLPPPPERQID